MVEMKKKKKREEDRELFKSRDSHRHSFSSVCFQWNNSATKRYCTDRWCVHGTGDFVIFNVFFNFFFLFFCSLFLLFYFIFPLSTLHSFIFTFRNSLSSPFWKGTLSFVCYRFFTRSHFVCNSAQRILNSSNFLLWTAAQQKHKLSASFQTLSLV